MDETPCPVCGLRFEVPPTEATRCPHCGGHVPGSDYATWMSRDRRALHQLRAWSWLDLFVVGWCILFGMAAAGSTALFGLVAAPMVAAGAALMIGGASLTRGRLWGAWLAAVGAVVIFLFALVAGTWHVSESGYHLFQQGVFFGVSCALSLLTTAGLMAYLWSPLVRFRFGRIDADQLREWLGADVYDRLIHRLTLDGD